MAAKQSMTLPQIAVAATVGVVMLWLFTALYWFAAGSDSWAAAKRRWQAAVERREKEQRLIARSAYWRESYERERARMPEFEEGLDLSSHWLRLVESVADANGLAIRSRKPIRGNEGETREGEVCEQQIEIGKWEATLENLVRTMYAFQTAEGEMIDIRKITVTPISGRRGFLNGSLTLTCAYTRGKAKPAATERPGPGGGSAAAAQEGGPPGPPVPADPQSPGANPEPSSPDPQSRDSSAPAGRDAQIAPPAPKEATE